jgi:hypothetical protein
MPYPDIDQLLRDERFDELARLSALPASRVLPRRSRVDRFRRRVRSVLFPARVADAGPVTIRRARPEDRPAVAQLAELEERAAPRGPVLVVEVGAEILAALALDGTTALAHPWRETAGLVDLLELRSRQLERAA